MKRLRANKPSSFRKGARFMELEYKDWLINELRTCKDGVLLPYKRLLNLLWAKEFYGILPHDENRATDGVLLRTQYAKELHIDETEMDFGCCRVLEALFGIAFRMSHELYGSQWAEDWDIRNLFWVLIENLGLKGFTDTNNCKDRSIQIHEILDRWLAREYSSDGTGSIFPISCGKDMRKVEIWTQMGLYLRNRWPI